MTHIEWQAMITVVNGMTRDQQIEWARKMPDFIKDAMRDELRQLKEEGQ